MNQSPSEDNGMNYDYQQGQSLIELQKMLFIYNAINDGWTVRKLDDGRYEFQKQRIKTTSDVCMDNYLEKFISYYMKIDKNKF
jgi:hypothetical protein